jgi:hypothetical protein
MQAEAKLEAMQGSVVSGVERNGVEYSRGGVRGGGKGRGEKRRDKEGREEVK